jgi:hypothetical protein
VRREHPSASAELILVTLVLEGRIDKDVVANESGERVTK